MGQPRCLTSGVCSWNIDLDGVPECPCLPFLIQSQLACPSSVPFVFPPGHLQVCITLCFNLLFEKWTEHLYFYQHSVCHIDSSGFVSFVFMFYLPPNSCLPAFLSSVLCNFLFLLSNYIWVHIPAVRAQNSSTYCSPKGQQTRCAMMSIVKVADQSRNIVFSGINGSLNLLKFSERINFH